jgi:hypothetical protein
MRSNQPEVRPSLKTADAAMSDNAPSVGRPTVTTARRPPTALAFAVIVAVVCSCLAAGVSSTAVGQAGDYMASDSGTGTICARMSSNGGEDGEDYVAPSYAEVVLRAQTVLYGRIRRRHFDQARYGVLGYTAEMEVYCTLKGRQTQQTVNISDAGKLQFRVPFEVVRSYVGRNERVRRAQLEELTINHLTSEIWNFDTSRMSWGGGVSDGVFSAQ